ncbi:glycosyltransferase [bacterium]|nr:glycosyltransferase [bacterium]
MKRVAWVMVTHNGGEEVLQALQTLEADLGPGDRIILVDNGSEDHSATIANDRFSRLSVIGTGANLPYAEANNLGVRRALREGYWFIGLINPDVRVTTGMTESLLHEISIRSRPVVVSPWIDYPNGRTWFGGGRIHWAVGWIGHRGLIFPQQKETLKVRPTDYVSGCCFLTTSKVWSRVGPLSGRYGMYVEDVDWSHRARMRGVHLFVTPAARLVHNVSSSSGGGRTALKMKYRTRAGKLFFRRNTPGYLTPFQFLLHPLIVWAYAVFLSMKTTPSAFRAYLQASIKPVKETLPWPPNAA